MKKLICLFSVVLFCGCHTDDFDIPPIIPPTTTTTTTTSTTTTTQPVVADDDEHEIVPDQLYAPRYDLTGATQGKISVWNPANSKKKGKAIWAGKYCDKIAWCTFFTLDGSFKETGKRAFPNESGNRPRFYSKTGINSLPKTIYLRIHVIENGQAKDVWVLIPDTQKRIG